MIAVAAVAYTVQLYMEFSGCMDIIIGSGRMFGVVLPENSVSLLLPEMQQSFGGDGTFTRSVV